MSPPGCRRVGSDIRIQWDRHIPTQPSSFSILKTGNSQQLPCLTKPSERNHCVLKSLAALSCLHSVSAKFFSLVWVAGKMLCRSQSSLLFCEEEGCLDPQATLLQHTNTNWATQLPFVRAVYRFMPGTPGGGTCSGGSSSRTLLTHCLESEAAGYPSQQ